MVEIYDTHEQSERVKGWLRENGGAILLGLVLAFGSLFGFKQWQLWQQTQREQASAEYQTLVDALEAKNLDAAVGNYETLKSEHADSSYTALAAMHLAKARLEAGQTELAQQLLEYAIKNAQPEAVRTVAKERLARIKLDQGKPDEALALLDAVSSASGFEPVFAEIRGDIYRAKGDNEKAAGYYQQALDGLEAGTGNRAFLEIKLQTVSSVSAEEGDAS